MRNALREFEIKDFRGIASAERNPSKDDANVCKNLDVRNINGDLITRSGYSLKYSAPTDARAKFSASSSLVFENFYVPDIGGGKEVTCLVQKGTLAGESSGQTLGIPASINIPGIWVTPYWDGSAWQNSWQWLNNSILTKILAVDPLAAGDKYKIKLDFTDATIISSASLNKWSVVNISKTPNEIAKVVLTYGEGLNVAIKISNNKHNWAAGDTVLLMKNYVPYNYLTGNYNASASEISFHKIHNDLRIGFGGQSGRLGLSVGYRKRFYTLAGFDFGSFTSNEVQTFATIDEIILDPYNSIGTLASIELVEVNKGTGTLTEGTYYFKLTAVLDGFNEILIAENRITIAVNSDIEAGPKLTLGADNKRITELKLYWSNDNELFYLQETFETSSTAYSKKNTGIFSAGFLGTIKDDRELNTDADAIQDTLTDANLLSNITVQGDATLTQGNAATIGIATGKGTYSAKITSTWVNPNPYWVFIRPSAIASITKTLSGLEANTTYNVIIMVYPGSDICTEITFGFNDTTPWTGDAIERKKNKSNSRKLADINIYIKDRQLT